VYLLTECFIVNSRHVSIKKKAYLYKSVFQNTFENEIEITFANGKADRLGDPGVDGRIILRCIFRKCDVGLCTGSSWLRIGTSGGHL
jgi:hypothetical protein